LSERRYAFLGPSSLFLGLSVSLLPQRLHLVAFHEFLAPHFMHILT
jgi:hypothetical protein